MGDIFGLFKFIEIAEKIKVEVGVIFIDIGADIVLTDLPGNVYLGKIGMI